MIDRKKEALMLVSLLYGDKSEEVPFGDPVETE
jgi:hypothetical protein